MRSCSLILGGFKEIDCGIYFPQISVHMKYHNRFFSFYLDREFRVWKDIVWPCFYLLKVGFWLCDFTDFNVILGHVQQTSWLQQCSLSMDVLKIWKWKVILKAACWWTVIRINGSGLNRCLGICHPVERTRVNEWVQLLLPRIHLNYESVEKIASRCCCCFVGAFMSFLLVVFWKVTSGRFLCYEKTYVCSCVCHTMKTWLLLNWDDSKTWLETLMSVSFRNTFCGLFFIFSSLNFFFFCFLNCPAAVR